MPGWTLVSGLPSGIAAETAKRVKARGAGCVLAPKVTGPPRMTIIFRRSYATTRSDTVYGLRVRK